MRATVAWRMLFIATVTLLLANERLLAVPVTGGTGPGGVGTTNGLSTLDLWLRADRGVYTDTLGTVAATVGTDNVANWSDQSGNGFHVTQGTLGNQPNFTPTTLNSSSLPVVSFTSANGDGLTVGSFVGSTVRTSFAVTATANNTQWSPIYSQGNNGTMSFGWVGPSNGNRIYNVHDNVALGPLTTSTFGNNQYAIASGLWNPAAPAGTQAQIVINGVTEASSSIVVNGTAGETLAVGRRPGSSQSMQGSIAELVIYDAVLNTVQRNIIENHLSSKYDLALASPLTTDHYSGDTLAKGHFDFGVFGIGNDGTSSVLSAGHEGLGIEIGSLGSSTWVLSGRDGGLNGVTTADVPNQTQRWQRSWNVDVTGSIGAVDLAFDWNDAGVTAPFNSSFIGLYYRANVGDVFTFLTTGTLDLANQRVDFSGITLTDGFYYTLGSVPVPEPSTGMLLGCAVSGLLVRRLRRKQPG